MPRPIAHGLIISRREGEQISINHGQIVITVLPYEGGKTRLHIAAPRELPIYRQEIQDVIDLERGAQS